MTRILLFIIALTLMAASLALAIGSALAQDRLEVPAPEIFIPGPKDTSDSVTTQDEAETPDEAAERLLKEKEAKSALANQYYNACVNEPEMLLRPEALKIFCSCMSAQSVEVLSMAELENMALARGAAIDKERLMTKVYAPCLDAPARQYAYEQCYYNDDYQTLVESINHLRGLCMCMADDSVAFVQEVAPDLLAALIAKRRQIYDPMGAIMRDPSYRRELSGWRQKCLAEFGRKD